MTRRITLTIIAIVIGATTVVGLGTTLLSYRSNRQQVVDEVAALTRNLAGIAQFSRSIPIGASNDCAAIKAEARRLLCEKLAATKEAQNEQLRAERDRLRVSFQLDGIAYVLYDTRRDIAIDLAGNATEDVELPEGIDPTEIDFERIVGGEQIVGVRNRIAYATAGGPSHRWTNPISHRCDDRHCGGQPRRSHRTWWRTRRTGGAVDVREPDGRFPPTISWSGAAVFDVHFA